MEMLPLSSGKSVSASFSHTQEKVSSIAQSIDNMKDIFFIPHSPIVRIQG